jgi:hypothetical protein
MCRRMSLLKSSVWVRLRYVWLVMRMRIRSCALVDPPHDFQHPSRCYYELPDIKKYSFGRNIHTEFNKNPFICSRFIKCVLTDTACEGIWLGWVGLCCGRLGYCRTHAGDHGSVSFLSYSYGLMILMYVKQIIKIN